MTPPVVSVSLCIVSLLEHAEGALVCKEKEATRREHFDKVRRQALVESQSTLVSVDFPRHVKHALVFDCLLLVFFYFQAEVFDLLWCVLLHLESESDDVDRH